LNGWNHILNILTRLVFTVRLHDLPTSADI